MADGIQQGGPDQAGRPNAPGRARSDARLGIVIGRPFGIPVFISPYWFVVAAVLVVLYSSNYSGLPGVVHGTVPRYLVAVAFVVLLFQSNLPVARPTRLSEVV